MKRLCSTLFILFVGSVSSLSRSVWQCPTNEIFNNRRSFLKGTGISLVSFVAASAAPQIKDQQWKGRALQELIIPRANAIDMTNNGDECDSTCLEERRRIIEDRRAMMLQSKTNTRRQDVFELSRQRAAMYNATYRGMECPPVSANGLSIPCI